MITGHRTRPDWSGWQLLLFWPIYGIYFYTVEWLMPGQEYYAVWCPLDEYIPFNELFLLPYLGWFVYMVAAHAYTFFVDKGAFRRLMGMIFLTFGITCVIFLVFPTCQQLRPASFSRDNILTRLMAWFYTTDTSTNVCPSLHVCGSIASAAAFTDTQRFSGRGWKLFHWSAAALISISTVFVKQHSVVDVVCGVAMSAAACTIVYRRTAKAVFVFKTN